MKSPVQIIALLQARTSSTRLPGKVMLPILGIPMILRQIERLKRSTRLQALMVVTSTDPSDDALADLCEKNDIACFRGNLKDVLDRFYQAVAAAAPSHVIRLTADCPLADPSLIDKVIEFHFDGQYDYSTNALEPTYPDGLDVEIFRFEALAQAWREAVLPSEREHVTPFINQHPERFRLGSYKANIDLSHLRWTVDELVDFELVSRIYNELYKQNPAFGTADILKLLDRFPELRTLNTTIRRNEGLEKSLAADKAHRCE